MADKKTEDKDESKPMEATTPALTPVAPLARATAPVMIARAARPAIGSEPKRLSKGQRTHQRRQKQAREAKIIDRR
jgi:hypothetical protein